MKLLITGSESFVGKELISQCQTNGIECIGVDFRKATRSNCHQVDIRSKEIVDFIPKDIDGIIHLAALSRDSDCNDKPYECFDVNVMGTLNLINAAEKKQAKQFIFASSEWVYDSFRKDEIGDENSFIDISKHASEYALSKLVGEATLRQKYRRTFCATTILRFGIIYGPRRIGWSAVESLFHSIKNDNEITVGSLKTARCFVHVSDIASGIIKSIGLSGFDIINLAGDKLISLGDIIETGTKILNRRPRVMEREAGNVSIRNVSNEKAKRLIKWEPVIDLHDGLKSIMHVL